jgi:hypothetical protein
MNKTPNRQQGIAKSGAEGIQMNFLLYLNFGISIEVRC